MWIGVDATCWDNTRGYGRHARGLLSTLVRIDQDNRYVLFTDSEGNIATLPREAEVKLVPSSRATAIMDFVSVRDAFDISSTNSVHLNFLAN
jgi:hypothetical protein